MGDKGVFSSVRIPTAPPSKNHGDKKKYNRKLKHKGVNDAAD